MPTIPSAMAMESLLQYTTKESLAKKPSPAESREIGSDLQASAMANEYSLHRFYSPSLYTTPAPGPIPDVSTSYFSPNIYIVNRKRREGIFRPADWSQADGIEDRSEVNALNGGDSIPLVGSLEKGMEEDDKFGGLAGDIEIDDGLHGDFLDPRDSVNVCASGSDVEDGDSLPPGRYWNQMSVKSRGQDEYYDTADEFFSDGSLSNSSYMVKHNTEKELRSLKLGLIEESGRRKAAEERLLYLTKQFEKLLHYLSHSRSSLPESLSIENLENEIDPSEIFQEFVVLRYVSEALETELALDEAREAFIEIIGTKNHEVSRLHDRMMYHETMNREMSQRNQEAVDLARKRRLRRQKMRKWIWGCVGLSITAGASFLAHSYLPSNWKNLYSSSSSDTASTDVTE